MSDITQKTKKHEYPETNFIDRHGHHIAFHDLLTEGLIDQQLYYVDEDEDLGVCIVNIMTWTKEKLTWDLARTLEKMRI